MARTRKKIQSLNLYKYDVLIEDSGPRSDYFKLSQFDGYFSGGRNAFLIAGSGILRPNSNILVEVLNKDFSAVYSVPLPQYSEGNSRLVQVEVYEDTPIGPGKLVILGSVDRYADGTPVPDEWKNKYNVRWITDVIISPLVENTTPIRFVQPPVAEVEEKFYAAPVSSSFTQSIIVPVDVELTQKTYNVVQNGYTLRLIGPDAQTRFFSENLGGRITGSLQFNGPNGPETASINLPITRIYNRSIAVSEPATIQTNKKTIISPKVLQSSGTYNTEVLPYGIIGVTSSINLDFSRLTTNALGTDLSYAQIRIVNLTTLSGEVKKVRLSYKTATTPGEYTILGDTVATVGELLSVDSGSRAVSTGKLRDIVLDDYWYAATMSLQKNEISPVLPTTYYTSSLVTTPSFLTQCCTTLLDSITATPTIVGNTFTDNVSYFIGTRDNNAVRLFPQSEYSLQFNAFVSRTSASVELIQPDYSLEVYLVPLPDEITSRVLETDPRGQLLGTLTPEKTFLRQNFETVNFTFTPKIQLPSSYGLRFVVYGGYWDIADISLTVAEEPFFSPDELTLLTPNDFKFEDVLQFKVEYLDVDNNSTGIETTSLPTYFTGSPFLTVRPGVIAEANELRINDVPVFYSLLENTFTGLTSGGLIAINPSYAQAYDISEGEGFLVDNFTNPRAPVYSYVTWSAITGVTASAFASSGSIATWPRTQIAIKADGTVFEKQEPFTVDDYRDYIVLGRIVHVDAPVIQRTLSLPLTTFARQYHWFDFIYNIGVVNLSGNNYLAGATNLTLQKTSGQTYRIGSNYTFNTSKPDITNDVATNPVTFAYRYRNGSPDGFTEQPTRTTVVPNLYDNGSGILQTVNNNQYTIQRIYFFGATATTRLQYGQAVYNSLENARSNVFTEIFSADPNLEQDASLRAYLIIRGGGADLSNLTDAVFIAAASGLAGSSGGGGATSLNSLNDVTITDPIQNNVLVYDDVLDQWTNQLQVPSASIAVSSSLAETASFATSASYALSASIAVSSSLAETASFATSASYAVSASSALVAESVRALEETAVGDISYTGSLLGTSSFAVSSSYALSASFLIDATPLPAELVSSSVQIDHNNTTNYVVNQHIDHSTVNVSAGNGLSGGGNITTTRTLTLDTGSIHFTGGVKTTLNANTVVSSSTQATEWTVASASVATNANNVNLANRTTNESGHLVFIGTTATGNQPVYSNTNIRVNPSVGEITATSVTSSFGVTAYTETVVATTGNTTVDLTSGTIFKVTTNGATTVTLPSSVSGKSFIVIVAYGGTHALTFTGGSTLKWVGGTAPTPTSVNGKFDIFTFFQDGVNTFATIFGQNF
jgi:hypothetical protein